MNRSYPWLLLMVCWATSSLAQTTLSGRVQTANGTPLPFASIALLNAKDSSLVKGVISKETGIYTIDNVRPGQYKLAASAVGLRPARSGMVEVGTAPVNVPVLTLSELAKTLGEVTVAAKKPMFEQQADRLIVNVQNSITAAGGSALDVLERSPGITVNQQNSSLTMSGKGGVMVMINGKLTRLPMATVVEMLAGMSASDIEKIELITTPPSQYDAEGDAGMINIITKKNTAYGTNGNLSATAGYGRYERASATLNLNHRSQKMNLYGGYSYALDRHWEQFAFNRILTLPDGPLMTDIVTNRTTVRTTHTAKIGVDYSLSPKTTLNALVSGFSNYWSGNLPTLSTISQREVPVSINTMTSSRTNRWHHAMVNVALRHVFTNKQEWSVDIDRLYYNNRQPGYYSSDIANVKDQSREQLQFQTAKYTPIRLWVLKTDFQKPLRTKGRVETGLKATSTLLNNTVELDRRTNNSWKVDSLYTNKYRLAESILAAYVSLNQPLDTKTTLQAGLRYEYTRTDLDTPEGQSLVHRRYGNFFPSVFISRKLGKNHVANLSYSRRITRPSFDDLAPFVLFFDPNTYVAGNPALRPTISDGLQGSYTYKDAYVFSLKYSADKNVIAVFQPHLDAANNRIYYYAENIARQQTISVVASLPVPITKWWQSQNNLTGLYREQTGTYQDKLIRLSAYNVQINSTHTFKLPRKFTVEATGFYIGPSVQGLYRSRGLGQLNVGIQKVLPTDKGTLRVSVSDVFWTLISRTYSDVPVLNFNDRITVRSEPRVVRLTYTRNFGSQTVKSANRRATSSDEERSRLISN